MARADNAVAEALGRAHRTLLEDLRKLEDAARPKSRETMAELSARLGATRQHIEEHFRFEEQNGYMDVVRKREPRLERAIEHLAEEHRQLAESLVGLVEQARTEAGANDRLRDEVRAWVERVRQHEVRENDLVQDAFELDIGPED